MTETTNDRKNNRFYLNLLITALTVIGCIVMILHNGGGQLSTRGLKNLKYFTVLSNLFRGVISAIMTVFLRKDSKRSLIEKLSVWNYAATCSVGLTFLVVFAFFTPLYGFSRVMGGANLFFHLLIPVLAMAEYIFFNERPVRFPESLIAILPPLVYGLCYLINLLVYGPGRNRINDWYGFAIWGIPIGLCIFTVICASALLIGLILNLVNRHMRKNDI